MTRADKCVVRLPSALRGALLRAAVWLVLTAGFAHWAQSAQSAPLTGQTKASPVALAPPAETLGVARASPATMRVGPREAIRSIADAARLAHDGEVIEIAAGEYRGQPAIWTQDELVIRSSGARAVMVADGRSAEGKAIWVVRGGRVRVENIEFRGARVADGNGAGIRFERGDLIIDRCAFFDNEMGVLTANREDMTLVVRDSEFGAAPRHPGLLHHLLYVGAIGRFALSGSRFSGGYRGHLVKSRARENLVQYNLLVDGDDGSASYELEFPNGGLAYVVGNAIGQSPTTDNPMLVAYGAEGARWSRNALYMAHNTLLNELPDGVALRVWERDFPAGVETWLLNNLTVGYGELSAPAFGRFEGNALVSRAAMALDHGLPLRLPSRSPLRGSVRVPGHTGDVDLLPSAEFVFPVGSPGRAPGAGLAPGAFQ